MKNLLTRTLQGAATPQAHATAAEVESGKLIATISYIFCPIAIVPFMQRNNAYSLFHAKQAVTLLVAAIALSAALFGVSIVVTMVKLGIVATILSLAFSLSMLGMVVLGALAAWNGKMTPLPVLGPIAELLFGNVQPRPAAE